MTDETPYIGENEELPMTERQASYVQKLCERDGLTFDPNLTRGEAHAFIASKQEGWLTRTEIRKVACPKCGARPGRLCAGKRHQGRRMNHRERLTEALRVKQELQKARGS